MTAELLALRAVVAGALVLVFALIGEVVQPKRFAGLFGAAPSIALANLAVIAATQGTPRAAIESRGMIAGAVAMVATCAFGIFAVRRWHAKLGAALMAVFWLGGLGLLWAGGLR